MEMREAGGHWVMLLLTSLLAKKKKRRKKLLKLTLGCSFVDQVVPSVACLTSMLHFRG